MNPKQREMDDVVKVVYETIQKQDAERAESGTASSGTLIVLCGDHGMNEIGNHGGSSDSETSTAMVLISPGYATTSRQPVEEIRQIDIVPTISTLFGLHIPPNSLGKVVASAIEHSAKSSTWLGTLQVVFTFY